MYSYNFIPLQQHYLMVFNYFHKTKITNLSVDKFGGFQFVQKTDVLIHQRGNHGIETDPFLVKETHRYRLDIEPRDGREQEIHGI